MISLNKFAAKARRCKEYKFVFVILVALFAGCGTSKKEEAKQELLLPVYGPKRFSEEKKDTVYHTVSDFSFTNQYRETITQKTTEGKIYIADFFFTTCQNICPVMTSQLVRVQDAIKNDDILILSHTVNPMHDTVEVLMQYADKYGAKKDKWHFLTGDKKDINSLAEKSYLVSAQDDGTPEGFVHSEKFLLIDRQRRIRGIYDGTDSLQVNKLINDISLLKKEKL